MFYLPAYKFESILVTCIDNNAYLSLHVAISDLPIEESKCLAVIKIAYMYNSGLIWVQVMVVTVGQNHSDC